MKGKQKKENWTSANAAASWTAGRTDSTSAAERHGACVSVAGKRTEILSPLWRLMLSFINILDVNNKPTGVVAQAGDRSHTAWPCAPPAPVTSYAGLSSKLPTSTPDRIHYECPQESSLSCSQRPLPKPEETHPLPPGRAGERMGLHRAAAQLGEGPRGGKAPS